MLQTERNAHMWVDLLTAEQRWKADREAVTIRAQLYLGAGLPLGTVLGALEIGPAEWEARVADLEAARAARRAARAAAEAARS